MEEEKFDEVVERIREVTGKRKKGEICEELGTTTVSLNARRNKNDFDANWAFKIAKKYSLSTDWILTGKGPKSLKDIYEQPATKKLPPLFEEIAQLQEWLSEITAIEPERRAWFKMELLDTFPAFKGWLGIIEAAKKDQQKAA